MKLYSCVYISDPGIVRMYNKCVYGGWPSGKATISSENPFITFIFFQFSKNMRFCRRPSKVNWWCTFLVKWGSNEECQRWTFPPFSLTRHFTNEWPTEWQLEEMYIDWNLLEWGEECKDNLSGEMMRIKRTIYSRKGFRIFWQFYRYLRLCIISLECQLCIRWQPQSIIDLYPSSVHVCLHFFRLIPQPLCSILFIWYRISEQSCQNLI